MQYEYFQPREIILHLRVDLCCVTWEEPLKWSPFHPALHLQPALHTLCIDPASLLKPLRAIWVLKCDEMLMVEGHQVDWAFLILYQFPWVPAVLICLSMVIYRQRMKTLSLMSVQFPILPTELRHYIVHKLYYGTCTITR